MRYHAIFWVTCTLAVACVEVPPREVAPSGADARAPGGWGLDSGTGRPPLAPVLHPPTCDPPLAGGFDGGPIGAFGLDARVLADVAQPATGGRPGRGDVLITELMPNPQALSDTAGEWIELHNPDPTRSLDLSGCLLDDGGASPRPLEALSLPAGAFVTLARTPAPGFEPDLVLSFSLGNEADRVALSCDGVEIDAVVYATATGFPVAAGASMALDPGAFDAAANDRADAFCLGQGAYFGGDQGTPGAPNPPCHGDGGVL